jgi:uncharacterized damage-inducible protein DinB
MTNEYERDMQNCRAGLEEARRELLDVVASLSDDDLDNTPRGQWPVRRIMEHVIYSEQAYARIIAFLREQQGPGDIPDCVPSDATDALDKLAASRTALLSALDGVDEETFYRIGRLGHEEYSVLSMLENEANHEREHAAQIKKTLDNG